MSVTIYDIGKRAGVSPSTVSRALSGSSLVSGPTRKKIIKIAVEMGYQPNSLARNLRTGKANMLAFITDNLASPLVSAMAAGAESWLRERGWTLFLGQAGPNFGGVEPFLSLLKQGHLAGLLIAGGWIRILDDSWIPAGVRSVYAHCLPASGRYPTILPDERGGAYAATVHLVGQGYRRIAMINGPYTWHACQARLQGFKEALIDNGIPYTHELVRYGDWKPDSGYRHARELLSQVHPNAIFVANDFMAVGALQAAHEESVTVPDELGIIGFDNREVTHITRPRLSSVQLPMYEIGQAAARSFLYLIDPDSVDDTAPVAVAGAEPLLIPCRPVIRATSTTVVPVERDEFPFY
ncbi:MAG: LacI family DNA-binding transcriptional regulator [Firmicutes bacterium]|nr:LacI family DNA-binding transcriptional regulator [Bacillota bacterium]